MHFGCGTPRWKPLAGTQLRKQKHLYSRSSVAMLHCYDMWLSHGNSRRLRSLSRVKTLVESDSPVTRARATVPSGLDHFGGISQALRNAVCVPPLRSKQYLKTTFRSPFSAHARAAAASLPRTKTSRRDSPKPSHTSTRCSTPPH